MAGEGLAEEPRADYSTIVSHFAPSPASSSSNNDEERRGASARGRGVEIRDSTKISSLWNKYLPTLLPFVLVDGRATFFALFVTYDEPLARAEDAKVVANQLYGIFPFFQDIQVMLVVGLGLLLTFLPRYGLSVLTHNFLLLNFSTQWALALQGLIHHFHHGQVHLDLRNLLTAEFAAVTVLISVGAVLGRTSPCQLLLVATCEVPVYLASEWAIVTHLGVLDVGGTITIHVFSCYFGLGVSKALFGATRRPVHPKETPTPRSDLLSLVGTLILWVFWPSFVAVLCQPGDAQHRAILNTLLAMSASTVTTTVASSLLERDGKLSPCHLQNGSLAGGVAIGAVADMAMELSPFFTTSAASGDEDAAQARQRASERAGMQEGPAPHSTLIPPRSWGLESCASIPGCWGGPEEEQRPHPIPPRATSRFHPVEDKACGPALACGKLRARGRILPGERGL
uniref:Ammonium transporter AmtB-like domain-containing protein n=1 Tax=Bubo bubo TaxID=30461 RepID=A0A8C0FP28_BUBBB